MPPTSADALLFDLGRVVIDIDFNQAFSRWAGHARCDQKLISERFRYDTAYKRHELGEIDSKEFFANLRASLGIDISDAQLLDGWNSIHVGEMPGISELLAKAAAETNFMFSPLGVSLRRPGEPVGRASPARQPDSNDNCLFLDGKDSRLGFLGACREISDGLTLLPLRDSLLVDLVALAFKSLQRVEHSCKPSQPIRLCGFYLKRPRRNI